MCYIIQFEAAYPNQLLITQITSAIMTIGSHAKKDMQTISHHSFKVVPQFVKANLQFMMFDLNIKLNLFLDLPWTLYK